MRAGSSVVVMFDSQSKGRGFNSRPVHHFFGDVSSNLIVRRTSVFPSDSRSDPRIVFIWTFMHAFDSRVTSNVCGVCSMRAIGSDIQEIMVLKSRECMH
jgi:hypothetical protein